tara:strand:+ start:3361 stop:3645 length:285 start_codon:yes stop_codon:yes gene_type:complete
LKKIVLALAVFGCGEFPDKDFGQECEVYHDMYSHTVLFCGGRDVENVEDVFQVCNYQHRADRQVEDCVANFDLMEFDDDCDVQHVCVNEWTEDQ